MMTMRAGYADDLQLAHVIADQVDALTMSRFKAMDLQIETKPDATPVTDADRAAEELIRGQLSRTRPRDAVIGDELPHTGNSTREGVLDPIHVPNNRVRGAPAWATVIASP